MRAPVYRISQPPRGFLSGNSANISAALNYLLARHLTSPPFGCAGRRYMRGTWGAVRFWNGLTAFLLQPFDAIGVYCITEAKHD